MDGATRPQLLMLMIFKYNLRLILALTAKTSSTAKILLQECNSKTCSYTFHFYFFFTSAYLGYCLTLYILLKCNLVIMLYSHFSTVRFLAVS